MRRIDPLLIVLSLASLAFLAWPTPGESQQKVRRCTAADGSTILTDKPCAAIDATDRMPALPSGGIYGRPRRVSCARTLDELSYEVAYAIDLQDANRLAGIYHWVGMDSRNAYRVFNQLESIVKRPLVDIGPAGGGIDAEPRWVEDAEGNLVPIYPKPRAPTGLRLEQSTRRDGTATSRTVFGLRRHFGCLWISL